MTVKVFSVSHFLKSLFQLITILLLFLGCASQVPPSGGPFDKIPPRIVTVSPENKSTLVPLDHEIEFEFSESMDRKSLQKAVFITPNPGEDVKFKWKGRKLRIEFKDSLKTDRTYVITLGTDLKDSHGNALSQSYTLAFSTGVEISKGEISGRVYSEEKVKGILIWAYILEADFQPDPRQKSGDYITQTDNNGTYELTNLSEGLYRIFAIRDTDNNRFFETGLDGIGVPSKDLQLTKEQLAVSNINFKVTIQDTIGPALISVSAQDQMHLTLNFDEDLLPQSTKDTDHYKIRVKGKSASDSLKIKMAFPDVRDPRTISLITELQTPRTEYEIMLDNLFDLSFNSIDPNFNSAEFIGGSLPDTIKPTILLTAPKDSAWAVPLNSNMEFHFSEALNQNSFERSFHLRDSSSSELNGTFSWQTPASVQFSLVNPLQSLIQYSIAVKLDSVFDLAGNSITDSTFQLVFTSINIDTLSSISGTISDRDSTAAGKLFLTAKQPMKDGASYKIEIDEPGPYQFTDILPGTYAIEGFRDRDANGQYSYGTAFPFQPAERFIVYSDSIKARARWPNEGNEITFQK